MSKIILQERDLKLLSLLNQYEIMTTKQIQNLLFLGVKYTTMLRRLRLLEENKYIKQGVILDNYSRTWQLSQKALSIIPDASIYNFNNRNTIHHDTLITQLRIKFSKVGLGKDWTSGFKIKAEAFRNLKHRAKYQINPDGLMIEPLGCDPKAFAIEMELTPKSEMRYTKVFYEYSKNYHLNGVWYFVKSFSQIKTIEKILRRKFIKINNLWFSLIDDALKNDEFKIYDVTSKAWYLVSAVGFKNYKKITSLPAHHADNGVSSFSIENLETVTVVKAAESLSNNDFDSPNEDKLI